MTKIQLPLFEDELILPTQKYHVSYSEISDFLDCSYRHKLKHIDKIILEDGSIHTAFGGAIHDAIEQHLINNKELNSLDAEKDFKNRIKELSKEIEKKDIEEFSSHISDIFEQVPGFLNETFPDYKVFAAELPLFESIKNQPGVYVKGFIDAVIKVKKKRGKGYEYYLLDWKGQRLSAPIMTPNGWTTMGQLKIGDEITSSNGGKTKVIGIYPLGLKDVYKLTLKDGSIVECTDDHLWSVSNSIGKTKILTTKEIINNKNYRFLPVLTSPVIYNMKYDYDITPYNMGLLLGDGSFVDSSVKITSNDIELIENINNEKDKLEIGYKCIIDNKTPVYTIRKAKTIINNLNLSGKKSNNKFIPEMYKFGSPDDRLALIQGLLDTDGWVQKGIPKFSTTSEQLALDLKEITCSLGGYAFISKRQIRKGANYPEYIVTVKLPKNMQPFRLKRKLKKWNPNPYFKHRRKIVKIELVGQDKMQCIKVDAKDSLYVTNDFIVTHNTTSWGWKTDQKQSFQKQLQLMLYKHFFCQLMNIPLTDVKCGFVLIKRTVPKKRKPYDRLELVPISVGPKAIEKSQEVMNDMINKMRKGFVMKNRRSCEPFCPYLGTHFCK